MPNYSFTMNRALPEVNDGDTISDCNFTQAEPNTSIFSGKKNLHFLRCNLTNCSLPADATIENSSNRQKSFCSHLHPDFVRCGLPQCAVDCVHVIDFDTVIIDGQIVETIYHYEDKIQ